MRSVKLAVLLALAAAPAAPAATLGDLETEAGAAYAGWLADDGAHVRGLAGTTGFVAPGATIAPALGAGTAAWAEASGIFSGPLSGPGVLRAPGSADRIDVAADPRGGHVIAWAGVDGSVLVTTVGATGETGPLVRASAPGETAFRLVTTRDAAWLVWTEGGRLRAGAIASGDPLVTPEFDIDPEGGGDFALADAAPSPGGGVLALTLRTDRRGRTVVALSDMNDGLAYTRNIATVGLRQAALARLGRHAVVAWQARGEVFRSLVPLGPDLVDRRLPRAVNVTRSRARDSLQDVVAGTRAHVLVATRGDLVLHTLGARSRRLTRTRAREDRGLLAANGRRVYAAWEATLDRCTEVLATRVGSRAAVLGACP